MGKSQYHAEVETVSDLDANWNMDDGRCRDL